MTKDSFCCFFKEKLHHHISESRRVLVVGGEHRVAKCSTV